MDKLIRKLEKTSLTMNCHAPTGSPRVGKQEMPAVAIGFVVIIMSENGNGMSPLKLFVVCVRHRDIPCSGNFLRFKGIIDRNAK